MAQITVEPIIENTTMTKYVNNNNVALAYFITPIDGYVLHDSRKDFPSMEDDTVMLEGFSTYGVSVPISYDFVANPYNLYTKLASEVPADQIFGGGNNEEVM